MNTTVDPLTKPWPMLPDLEWTEVAEFWQGLTVGELRLPRCSACERFQWYPLPRCPACGAMKFHWVAIALTGTVYSFTVVRRPFIPGIEPFLPLKIIIVTPDAAPEIHVLALAGDEGATPLGVGDSVAIGTRAVADGVFLPVANRLS
jgi:uncharacterized OB-fold protein